MLLLAYDASEAAQISAAQALFGGIALSGRLPVAAGNYPEGAGLHTEKTRLGYSLPEEVGVNFWRSWKGLNRSPRSISSAGSTPGCQILIAKDGVVIYERSFGTLDYGSDEEVTAQTIYDLASITKAAATPR